MVDKILYVNSNLCLIYYTNKHTVRISTDNHSALSLAYEMADWDKPDYDWDEKTNV
jgi:hypothetical protein